jgi:pimeloyl-ACP methyl ester carboxylesterase
MKNIFKSLPGQLTDVTAVFLAQPWAGLAMVVLVAFVAWLVGFKLAWLGILLNVLAAVLLAGVLVAAIKRIRSPKPPGKLYRVKGRKMHLLAEGEKGGRHPVIWVPGGHGSGISLNHLHKGIREETRSILFDRTGSGWSDAMTGPVTTSGEVERLKLLLESAGETGPWVLAGHSFGGLFCANFAHHYPELVAGVVLLDSTPPWNVAYAGQLSFPPVLRKSWWGSLVSHFGLQHLVEPEVSGHESMYGEHLADVARAIDHNAVQPKAMLAEASVFRSSMRNPFDMVIGKGALGHVPLLMFSQNPTEDEQADLRKQLQEMVGLSDKQTDNLMDGLRDSNDQQVALSTHGKHLQAPPGSSHMFPYEVPELVLEQVRLMINRKSEA